MPPDTRAFKDSVYEQLARVGKAASSPKRLELLDLLAQGPRTVEDLAAETATSIANCSQHLQVLRSARLVDASRRGLHVEYRLAGDEVARFTKSLRELATARLAEVEKLRGDYFGTREAMEPNAREELLRRVRRGEVTVLDVRPAREHAAGHLPGALSIPLRELAARLHELPRDRPVVAYCRGPYCAMAAEAVSLLRKKGLEAHRLDEGVDDWRARGWRIARSATRGGR